MTGRGRGRPKIKSLLEAREFHLAECRYENLRPKTLRAYTDTWTHFERWCVANGIPLVVRSITAANVAAAANAITERGHGKRGGASAKRAFVVNMKVAVRFLVYEDVLEADVLAKLRRPKVPKPAKRPLETWEIQAIRGELAQGSTALRDLAMFALSLDTGVRAEELLLMRVEDFDFESCRVTVWGKGAKQRVVPFGGAERGGGKTAKLLRDYIRWRPAPRAETHHIWLSYNGKDLGYAGWLGAFTHACQRAGIADRTPHELRHTFATRYLVRNPGDVEGLRYTMGHLSDDEYRTYTAEAGRIIADMLGRESVFEEATEERPNRRAPTAIRERGELARRGRTAYPKLLERQR